MALTDNQKLLIHSIATNNMKAAKQRAIDCCNEDKTQKNALFVERYKSMLNQQEKKLVELPQDVSRFICAEDVSETFNVNRYFLSDREHSLADQIMRMSKVAEKLKEMKISYRNSTLLYGESGTGKTMFGRYIAYKFKLPFLYLKFSTLVDSYMGNTAKNITKAFEFALKTPCVFMLDELDAISTNRTESAGSGTVSEMNRTTITIMQELDRITNDAIILAATNRIDSIDSAILRRFSTMHEVKPFDHDEKIQLLDVFLSDVGVDFSGSRINSIISVSGNQSAIINRAIMEIAADVSKNLEDGESDG